MKAFKNPAKEKWIKFQIALAVVFSFLVHLPYFFQFEIEKKSQCTDSEDDIVNSKSTPFYCWDHIDIFEQNNLYMLYSFAYQVSEKRQKRYQKWPENYLTAIRTKHCYLKSNLTAQLSHEQIELTARNL